MVEERKKIGILFNYSEGWIGGTYYFINLVKSLNLLEDTDKPHIIVYSDNNESYRIIQETEYPYLSFLNSRFHYTIFERIINKISRILLKKDLVKKGYDEATLPALFGYYEQLLLHKCHRRIYWIPDLQDKYYPEYLGLEVAASREIIHRKLNNSNSEIVFSSNDSKSDFEKFYPGTKSTNYVMSFAVNSTDLAGISKEAVFAKYHITFPYFFSPNQFWAHKNHWIVLKAVKGLKEKGKDIYVIFTGNENTGGGRYAHDLKSYVKHNGLENNCFFLGFIDRKEQLLIMKESLAVIQPSKFEGWSTVVEDAKSIGKWLILSELKVHKEQINSNVSFFSPDDELSLIEKINEFNETNPSYQSFNYNINIKNFAESFIAILNRTKCGN